MSARRHPVRGIWSAPRRARRRPARRRLPRALPPPRCGGRRSRLGEGAPGDFDELLKRARDLDRDIREHLAIHLDASLLEAVHELVVCKAVLAGRSVDARDPQGAHVALALLAVAIRVGERMLDPLVGVLVEPMTGSL